MKPTPDDNSDLLEALIEALDADAPDFFDIHVFKPNSGRVLRMREHSDRLILYSEEEGKTGFSESVFINEGGHNFKFDREQTAKLDDALRRRHNRSRSAERAALIERIRSMKNSVVTSC